MQWLAYWTERVDKILNGEDDVKGCLIPLEVMDAIIETHNVESSKAT